MQDEREILQASEIWICFLFSRCNLNMIEKDKKQWVTD